MSCVNIKHKDFIELQEKSNLSSLVLEMRVSQWQKLNGEDSFPTLEEINQEVVLSKVNEDLTNVDLQEVAELASELDVLNIFKENGIIPTTNNGKVTYTVNGKKEPLYDNVSSAIVAYITMFGDLSILNEYNKPIKENIKTNVSNKISIPQSILLDNKGLLESDLTILNKRLKQAEFNNVSYKLTKNEDDTYDISYFYESQTTEEADVDLIVQKLKKVFPQLKMAIIDPEDLGNLLNQSSFTTDQWDSIPSFVIGDTVYLVRNRYTNSEVIEELLHPFINSIYLDNPELFNSLFEDALSLYPDLFNEIQRTYSGIYNVEDIKKEFLTQSLQREYEKPKTTNLVKRFLDWLKDLILKFSDKPLTVNDLNNLSLSQVAMLLYNDEARIFMNSFENKPYYHIDDSLRARIQKIQDNIGTNTVQDNIIETIFNNQKVLFLEEDHIYQDDKGEVFNSVTTIIKGKLDETDPEIAKYEINRTWGTQLDYIAEQILLNKSFEDLDKSKIKDLPLETAEDFYKTFQVIVKEHTDNGTIILPQIVLNDSIDKVAGKPDFILITKNGEISILDLKVSKNSSKSTSHNNTSYGTKLLDKDGKVIRLTTRGQHTVQVGSYAQMLNNYGLDVRDLKTIHYLLKVKETLNDKKELIGQEIQDIIYEGSINHNLAVFSQDLNLVPLVVSNNRTEEFNEDEAKKQIKQMNSGKNLVENLEKVLDDWRIVMDTKVVKSKTFKNYLNELGEFIDSLKHESDTTIIYSNLLYFYSDKLKIRNEAISEMITNGEEITTNRVNIFKLYAEEMSFIKNLLQQTEFLISNPEIDNVALLLQTELEDFNNNYDTFRELYIEQIAAENLQSDVDLKELLNEAIPTSNDISTMSTYARRMVESGDKLLTIVDTLVKNTQQAVKDLMKTFEETVAFLGNKIVKTHTGKKGEEYHFMLSKNKKNEITGHIVDNLNWYRYKEIQDSYYDKCYDEAGKLKSYQYVDPDLSDIEQEKIRKFNVDLFYARKKKREFDQEEVAVNGLIEDGEFHKYSKEFKDARNLLFRAYINDKFNSISWIPKETTTKKQLITYYNKYYNSPVEYASLIFEKGVPTGEIEWKEKRFPKSEYIEKVITEENELLNPQYVEIMSWANSINPEQKAKYDFYVFYTEKMKELLGKLPEKYANRLNGKIAKVKQSLMTEATVNLKGGWFKVFVNSVKDFFSLRSEDGTVMVYSDNEINQQTLPILFIADFKSENLIKYLKNKQDLVKLLFNKKTEGEIRNFFLTKGVDQEQINKLIDLDLKITDYKSFNLELNKIKNSIYLEQSKITAQELETDLSKNISVFAEMVETYSSYSDIENTIQLIKDKIKNKKYTVESSLGDKLKGKGTKEEAFVTGENSNVYKRLNSYLDMVFYRNSKPFNSKVGQIAKKTLSVMSLRSVGLNPFGQWNNYLIGKISNIIESNPLGKTGLYWGREHALRSNKEYIKSLSDFNKSLDKGSEYKLKHLKTNKYDAVVDFFNMERGYTPAGTYGQFSIKDQLTEKAFYMQQKIEYGLQTQTGISITMAKTLTNDKGETLSIYDALDFDKTIGKVSLKPGFSLPTKEKYNLTNYIYEVNAAIHGNYAVEDKMAIQSSLLGELVSVYRKHIVPGYDQRFRKAYYNDVRGWQEGRYVTATQFFKTLAQLRDLKYSWDSLTDTQKINMKKNLIELGFVLGTFALTMLLAAGADDDDSKLYNAFRVSIDKLNSEMLFYYPVVGLKQQGQFLKNPSAVLSYAGDIADVFTATLKTATGDPYFKTGVNKGELRIYKEFADVLPILQMWNKWQSYETVKTFYIK